MADPAAGPAGPPPSRWPGVLAGSLGGAAAGVFDAAVTVSRGTGNLSGARVVWLSALAVGLGMAAGAALALGWRLLADLLGLGLRRAWAGATAAALLAAPLVGYDAFALFGGARASRVPGHQAISVGLLVLGLASVWLAGRGYLALLGAGRTRPARPLALLALLVLAVGCHLGDRHLLPRLYPWFHVSLGLVFLVAVVLAARLVLAPAAAPAADRGRALLALAGTAVLLAVSFPSLLRSPIVRHTAHERTQLAALLLRVVPLPQAGLQPRSGRRPVLIADEADEGPPLPAGPRRPEADVVLITIDALRADHVGAYGYRRPTTPNIDALARQGVRFERAYAQAPHTSFSVASMLTGKYYPTIARLAPGDPHDPIAEVLRRYGWKTAAFYPPAVFFVDASKLKAYQDNNFRFEYVKVEFLDAFARVDQIDQFFEVERPQRAFLWLHLFEPHEPYDERPGFSFGKADLDRYDSEIAYADAALGKLLAHLRKSRPGAVVILTADHGEEFDEHKGRYHGQTLYEEQIRVPLIIAIPGMPAAVVPGPVELIDLAPTILGLLDIPVPARMRGTDLGPWMASPPAANDRLPPAFAEVADKRMIVWGTDKLICDLQWGYCTHYDLQADPGEHTNLAEARPQRTQALRGRLDEWLDDHVRYEPQLVRGLANPDGGVVPKAIERGRLGDLKVVGELAAMLLQPEVPLPVRREAARLLVSLPPKAETQAGLVTAMRGDDHEVSSWAAVAATRVGDPQARAQLRQLLAQPPGGQGAGELHTQAALALAGVHDPAGVPLLAAALDDCAERVLLCQRIIIKLGDLGDRAAVPALLQHLPEVQNRREMVEALGKIADPLAVPALIARLKSDEYVPVRAQAALALGTIGGPTAQAALRWSLRHEHEPSVLGAVRTAQARRSVPPAR